MVATSAGGSRLPWQRTPTTNPFLTNSKKSDGRNMLQTHINTVEARTFQWVHTAIPGAILKRSLCGAFAEPLRSLCGAFAEPLRSLCGAFAEPLRSKDRGFFSYNIDNTLVYILEYSCTFTRNPIAGYIVD